MATVQGSSLRTSSCSSLLGGGAASLRCWIRGPTSLQARVATRPCCAVADSAAGKLALLPNGPPWLTPHGMRTATRQLVLSDPTFCRDRQVPGDCGRDCGALPLVSISSSGWALLLDFLQVLPLERQLCTLSIACRRTLPSRALHCALLVRAALPACVPAAAPRRVDELGLGERVLSPPPLWCRGRYDLLLLPPSFPCERVVPAVWLACHCVWQTHPRSLCCT